MLTDFSISGTAAYMSPEQAEGRRSTRAPIIFSFGALLYEMVSGVRAFDGTSTRRVLTAVLHDDPPPLTPSVVEPLVRRCLRKDPRDRFQTMSDVKEALERVGRESAAEPAVPRLSIAVLPFANTSADPETEYFSDGLAEEIISALAQIQGLKVIGRAWRACWSRAS
jgi:serine/threonine protein kinase